MSEFAVVTIEGVQKTLRDLKKYAPDLHKEITDSIKGTMDQAANIARAKYALQPMEGWGYPRKTIQRTAFPVFSQAKAQKGVQVIVNKKSSKGKGSYKVAALRQNDGGGVIMDMAGSATDGTGVHGQQFVSNLRRYGKASRIMWPAVKGVTPAIQAVVLKASRDAETTINNMLGAGKR